MEGQMSLAKKDRINRFISGQIVPQARVVAEIAAALRREYGDRRSALKTIVELTGANERAVKNWIAGKNGPNGANLIALCGHSDQVFESFLSMAQRKDHLKAKWFDDAKEKFRDIIVLLSELEETRGSK
jgi:hypothetical protein